MRSNTTGRHATSRHAALLGEVMHERRRLSRRGLLSGAARVAGGGALALGFGAVAIRGVRAQDGTPGAMDDGMGADMGQEMAPFADDIGVLNYALTLEHLEYAFYRDGIGGLSFGTDTFGQSIAANLEAVRDHEGAHVAALTEVIVGLGGTPVAEASYDFGDAYGSVNAFLLTAAALENTGVKAYDGAARYIANPDLLTAAGSIVAVEARHAAYLNHLLGEVPFPLAFEETLTPAEVLEIAGPFIRG